MKIILIAILSFLCVHGLIYLINKDLHQAIKDHRPVMQKNEFNLRAERLKLETLQRENTQTFKWVDKRSGHVQIPVDLAMDYYLRSLPQ